MTYEMRASWRFSGLENNIVKSMYIHYSMYIEYFS